MREMWLLWYILMSISPSGVREIPHNRHLIKIEVCGVKETVAMGMENWPGNRKQDVIHERLCHSLEGSVQWSLPKYW